ncbi:gag-polypeptide of LTR copia-type [Sesbania bispinosa]|nr:gag-polypeptide of LTR copia-type [Sesbania bispinosa]
MVMLKNNDQIPAKLPVFDGTNYERWTTQMKVVFRYQGVLDIILTGVTSLETNPTEPHRATHREQIKKDDKAIVLIHQCVDSNVLEKIIHYETTKEAWDTLATTYAGDNKQPRRGGDSWKKKKGKGKWKNNKQESSGSKVRIKRKKEKPMEREKRNQRSTFSAITFKYGHYADECSNPKVPRKKRRKHNLCMTLMMKKQ